jgi:hypothetical protein
LVNTLGGNLIVGRMLTIDAEKRFQEEITYNMIPNFDLVPAWKKKRYDSVVAKNLTFKVIQLGG